ncbi:MAG: monovalent cation/H(+) antiporter subunit G [Defluviitaleaceae bacterium]|nr:monovalent cation/H(+) antiporter subunit G [Defluviitaleaceae bacterium]
MIYILSYIIIGLGILFMLFGVIGLFQRKRDFYYRILIACKVDTVGMITIGIGMALRHGISFFTGKIFLILLIIVVLNPFVAHIVTQAAYKSGFISVYKRKDGDA